MKLATRAILAMAIDDLERAVSVVEKAVRQVERDSAGRPLTGAQRERLTRQIDAGKGVMAIYGEGLAATFDRLQVRVGAMDRTVRDMVSRG